MQSAAFWFYAVDSATLLLKNPVLAFAFHNSNLWIPEALQC